MKTFNTAEEVYEAIKDLIPDNTMYLQFHASQVDTFNSYRKSLTKIELSHTISDYQTFFEVSKLKRK